MTFMNSSFIHHWLDCKITEIIEVTECEPEAAQHAAQEFLSKGLVPQQYTLYFRTYGYVTVTAVLSDPKKFDHQRLCDPKRYNHTSGHDEAVFCWNDGVPAIKCSGGRTYRFNSNPN